MYVASICWLVVMIVCLVLEGATESLVALWFAGGALAALIESLFGASVILQIVMFVFVSAILLLVLRPVLRKKVAVKKTRTNADRLVGQQAVVTQSIAGGIDAGEVKVSGVLWTALCEAPVAAGAHVRIERVAGAKLYVAPVEEAEKPFEE